MTDHKTIRQHSIEDYPPLSNDMSELDEVPDQELTSAPSTEDDQSDSEPMPLHHLREDTFPFAAALDEDDEHVFIECPGATLFEPGTDEIVAGVRFLDDDDPSAGYQVIGKQVFPPTHTRWRRIHKSALGKIRRCQACQDYTVRHRRKEGADFFIPSVKHPKRKKLKSISHSARDQYART